MNEPKFLTADAIYLMHEEQLAEHGGAAGIVDQGVVDSIIGAPALMWQFADPKPTIPELAAAYCFKFATVQGFRDGNKRIALVSSVAFLFHNGWDITASWEEFFDVVMAASNHQATQAELEKWYTSRSFEG